MPFLPSSSLTLLSKSGDLEEELKNVTNNLKSLEAQAEKVKKGAEGQWISQLDRIVVLSDVRLEAYEIPVKKTLQQ